MKFTPEDLQKIETKKLANIIRKLNAGGTLTAREDRILAEAKLSGGPGEQMSGATNFAGSWDELAKNLGVSRRSLQTWRIDEKLGPQCPPDRPDGRKDIHAWLEFMVRFGLKRADEDLHPDDLPNDERRSIRDWKEEREKLMCVKLQREIDREDGKLIEAAELEIPLGATFMAFQNRYSQFPERAASRVVGFEDVYEIEDRLREEVDRDLRELNAAEYLELSMREIIASLPFDQETDKLLSLVTFAGQDRAALLQVITLVAQRALASIGRRVISSTQGSAAYPESRPEITAAPSIEPATATATARVVKSEKGPRKKRRTSSARRPTLNAGKKSTRRRKA